MGLSCLFGLLSYQIIAPMGLQNTAGFPFLATAFLFSTLNPIATG